MIVSPVLEVRRLLDSVRHNGKSIALVPTMGALHAGHASLISAARKGADFVVVSIFVNPLQFGPNEDYLRYPRPLDKDAELCKALGVDVIFAPAVEDIYAGEQLSFVEVPKLTQHLCGAFRPGHFRGVATVVLKLFNVIQPGSAYFGEKDYQQLCVVRRMVQDFNLPLSIVPVATLREPDGLALSSRNVYLDPKQRALAPILFRTLSLASEMVNNGETDAAKVKQSALQQLQAASEVQVEYFEVVDDEVQPVVTIAGKVRIASAIWIGKTRLIDNIAAGDTL